MADLYVSEFQSAGQAAAGNIQAPSGYLGTKKISTLSGSNQSVTLEDGTRVVEVFGDGAAWLNFSAAATTSTIPYVADTVRHYGVGGATTVNAIERT